MNGGVEITKSTTLEGLKRYFEELNVPLRNVSFKVERSGGSAHPLSPSRDRVIAYEKRPLREER